MNKDTFIGLALVFVVAVGAYFFPLVPGDKNAGGERAGLQEFIDGIKNGDVATKYVSRKLEPGQTSVKLYCNTSGNDVIADYGSITIPTGETASTTYQYSMFASSTSAIPASQDYTALAEVRRLLIGTSIATSSTATTTSSTYARSAGQGNGAVLVANNSCLYGYLQNLASGGGGAGCTGATCETATSTNRGTNPIFDARIHSLRQDSKAL